ncbi:hypothetical protein H4219_003651 [Mycoemilia scoparia]|uniref:Uncharacterized protein n=1 Tax=Mycoemilia scoparia TaxID=417184 RepID=A0A9W8DSD3_9FUNG|nr:hypothetical protein H4219_003651 [Mycoemilia scoparia]
MSSQQRETLPSMMDRIIRESEEVVDDLISKQGDRGPNINMEDIQSTALQVLNSIDRLFNPVAFSSKYQHHTANFSEQETEDFLISMFLTSKQFLETCNTKLQVSATAYNAKRVVYIPPQCLGEFDQALPCKIEDIVLCFGQYIQEIDKDLREYTDGSETIKGAQDFGDFFCAVNGFSRAAVALVTIYHCVVQTYSNDNVKKACEDVFARAVKNRYAKRLTGLLDHTLPYHQSS